ncbi:ribosomal protein S18-alanine N-acetyltransferase [Nocardioides sp. JQ2195]|uniref:ribosomal protein S18-alanine N-acetyltransferase n=1 Tax=Nocardioides sp. JQ2195 TaxID=2592334 RepID=UPI00143E1930|nr:ribosomal protein S18-alanine N-acetyltransferase [Nocardioides sp. JQ2195]QIX25804.1 ribosomal protein S18-alanine N-acetyltransferase [Nocardioides sp. JQ2195]
MIRNALAADVDAVVELEDELFGAEAWDADTLLDDLERAGRRFVVFEDDLEVIGYAITMFAGDIADLARIGVHPSRQREGIAAALLDHVVDAAREDGADRMLLEVSAMNPEALAFYDAGDFEQIDTRPRYYKDGSDAIVMRRSLGPSSDWSAP